jgi:hypothetical protein
MKRCSSPKGRTNAAMEAKRASENRDLLRSRTMVGAASFAGLLMCAFTAYGMLWGDRELLLEVWSLVKILVVTLIAWAGGRGLLRALSDLRFEDDAVQSPENVGRIRPDL